MNAGLLGTGAGPRALLSSAGKFTKINFLDSSVALEEFGGTADKIGNNQDSLSDEGNFGFLSKTAEEAILSKSGR